MENQIKLLELLQEIKEIAASQQNRLTKEEIQKYLADEGFSEEKLQAVYHYLGENNITVEGYSEKAKESRRDVNLKLYRQEIAQYAGELKEEQVISFLKGDASLKNIIIERYLEKVIELAQNYQKRDVPMDEMIAEGNVGLLIAMQIIEQNRDEYLLADGTLDAGKFYGTLNMEISHAMEMYIDDMTASKDWESTMLAKTNLLHEATKYMAEEIGRVPTIEELSEYTKISRDEIKDIMGLSEDAKRVASAE